MNMLCVYSHHAYETERVALDQLQIGCKGHVMVIQSRNNESFNQ